MRVLRNCSQLIFILGCGLHRSLDLATILKASVGGVNPNILMGRTLCVYQCSSPRPFNHTAACMHFKFPDICSNVRPIVCGDLEWEWGGGREKSRRTSKYALTPATSCSLRSSDASGNFTSGASVWRMKKKVQRRAYTTDTNQKQNGSHAHFCSSSIFGRSPRSGSRERKSLHKSTSVPTVGGRSVAMKPRGTGYHDVNCVRATTD